MLTALVLALLAGLTVSVISMARRNSSLLACVASLCAGMPFAMGVVVAHYLWQGFTGADKRAALVTLAISTGYLLHPLVVQRFVPRAWLYVASAVLSIVLAVLIIGALRNLPASAG